MKLDYREAARVTLREIDAIREYFEKEEGLTIDNLDSFMNKDIDGENGIYAVTMTGLGIIIDRDGELATGEEAFRIMTKAERSRVGKRILVGDKGRYVVYAGKVACGVMNLFEKTLDNIEKNQEDEDDLYC